MLLLALQNMREEKPVVQADKSIYDETQNPRKITTEKAKRRVYRAMLLRKGAINVAREDYDRKGRMVPTN